MLTATALWIRCCVMASSSCGQRCPLLFRHLLRPFQRMNMRVCNRLRHFLPQRLATTPWAWWCAKALYISTSRFAILKIVRAAPASCDDVGLRVTDFAGGLPGLTTAGSHNIPHTRNVHHLAPSPGIRPTPRSVSVRYSAHRTTR